MKGYMMKFHPYAEIFPLLTGDDFEKLKQDIENNGLQQPILLSSDGRIADGRNRYRACYELDIEPEYITHHGDDASLLHRVISLNLHRRHLTAGQRAMIALEIKPMFEAQAQENLRQSAQVTNEKLGRDTGLSNLTEPIKPIDSRKESAKATNVSSGSVAMAETIAKTSPVLKQAVQSGEISLNKAYEATKDGEFIESINTPNTEVKDFEKRSREIAQEWKRRQQEKAKQEKENPQPKSEATLNHKDTAERIKAFRQFLADEMPSTIKAGWLDDIQQRSWHITKLEEIQNQIDTILDMLGD